jgi:AraC-like DNA-binding protein
MVGDSLSFPQIFDLIGHDITFATGTVVTLLPRGALHMVQPQRVSEPLLRSYLKDASVEDRAAWSAMINGKPARSSDMFERKEENSLFPARFLRAHGLRYSAAAPLKSPTFEGYHGALWLARTEEQGDFSNAELNYLGELASDLSGVIHETRMARLPAATDTDAPWLHCLTDRVFIFDDRLKQVYPVKSPAGLDGVLHDHMIRQARTAFEQVKKKQDVTDRALLPDLDGDLWTFRVVYHKEIPAIGDSSYVTLCLQPIASDWWTLSNNDFQADSELSRLLPAVRFMSKEFRSSPTLTDIAKQVHLSPFHFHRRFTDLMGLTPKHFLLECQIEEAKRELVSRKKPLPQLATDCGFAHQSHFTSRFKQSTGLTPTRWRRLAARRTAS